MLLRLLLWRSYWAVHHGYPWKSIVHILSIVEMVVTELMVALEGTIS